ncbi:hypothetical protein RYX36_028538 [Vicia faba]
MLVRESIRKTKYLLHKKLKNFKCLIFGGYQKLPRALSFKPFLRQTRSNNNSSRTTYTSDQFYNEFYDILQSDLSRMNRSSEIAPTRDAAAAASNEKQSPEKNITENVATEKKNKNEGVHELALKMKELEMNDSGDVEQVLDIEEALHYYSRLKSPVYLDIVDKFFTDMHSEFSLSQSSVRNKHSKTKGRFGAIRL